MKRIVTISCIALIVTMLTGACKSRFNHPDKKIFHYNESSGILSLDPAYASGQSTIWPCNQLYNGLVDMDENLQVVPAIAKSWTITEDGKTYTFILRNDVQFHQTEFFPFEKPRYVTAADFVYSLGRILSPEVASPGAWIFQKVKRDKTAFPHLRR